MVTATSSNKGAEKSCSGKSLCQSHESINVSKYLPSVSLLMSAIAPQIFAVTHATSDRDMFIICNPESMPYYIIPEAT
jgi:hypothetical protein